MGIAAGSFDGAPVLLTTTFNKDYFPLFRRNRSGIYEEVSSSTGLAALTSRYLGWACGLADFTNTGTDEFWTANGHVYPTDKDYLEPVAIFRSTPRGAMLAYSFPDTPVASYRGGCAGDFNNDGKIDLLILPVSGSPILLRNDSPARNHWTGFSLRGTRSNRDAIGARVTIEACGSRQTAEVRSGGSYISRNDPRIHFGLGQCTRISRIEIRWPSGTVQNVPAPVLDRYQTVTESE
jgi:hypothetical protein